MPEGSYGYNFGRRFAAPIIRALGGEVTPEKVRFFEAWAQAEGTKAQFNPFATTRRGYPGESILAGNPAGVKNYPDLKTGLQATVDTLRLGYYTDIVKLIRQNDTTAQELAKAVANSPWGTGTGVLRVLGVSDADSYEVQRRAAKLGENRAKLEVSYQTRTLDQFRPSEAYTRFLEETGGGLATVARVASAYQPFTVTTPVVRRAKPADEVVPNVPRLGDPTPVGGGKFEGEIYILPTSWKTTHPTSNLNEPGWTGAIDLFPGPPGTPLGAPEAGVVLDWDPEGAQGGGRIRLQANSGAEYWIGHIDNGLAPGTQVKRGQAIGVISSDHDTPHAHIDKRQPPRRQRSRK